MSPPGRRSERFWPDSRPTTTPNTTLPNVCFREALAAGLVSPRDRAEAHKRLAFIHCAAGRLGDCETEFKLARQSDRNFALDKSEAGHPVWGPVYKKLQP